MTAHEARHEIVAAGMGIGIRIGTYRRPCDILPGMSLMVSVSGIRGIIGETLTDDVVRDFAAAYAAGFPVGSTIVIGRDGRPSGAAFAALRWVPEGSALRTPIFRIAARAAEQEWEALCQSAKTIESYTHR